MNQYSIEKVANAIIFFVEKNIQHFGKTKLMKLMYFADKEHLEKFGRVMFYDDYRKLPRGPVATLTYNIISSTDAKDGDDFKSYIDNFSNFIEIQKKDTNQKNSATRFNPKNSFDNSFFSKSEIEILESITKKYKTYTKEQISEESHSLKEYINTDMNDFISVSDMTENKELKDYLSFWKNEHKEFNKMLNN